LIRAEAQRRGEDALVVKDAESAAFKYAAAAKIKVSLSRDECGARILSASLRLCANP
jgi:hypothetical protein